MNYLAHGRHHLDQPWALAGTALPDWLAASQRRARLRAAPPARDDDPRARELARGVQAHLDDDARFHASPAFRACEDELTLALRAVHRDAPRQRCRFLGHVLAELLLDAELCARRPGLLAGYHDALAEVDAEHLTGIAEAWVGRELAGLPEFIGRFLSSRFLGDYRDDVGLARRLGDVARRVGLPPLADGTIGLLPGARRLVAGRADALLALDD